MNELALNEFKYYGRGRKGQVVKTEEKWHR